MAGLVLETVLAVQINVDRRADEVDDASPVAPTAAHPFAVDGLPIRGVVPARQYTHDSEERGPWPDLPVCSRRSHPSRPGAEPPRPEDGDPGSSGRRRRGFRGPVTTRSANRLRPGGTAGRSGARVAGWRHPVQHRRQLILDNRDQLAGFAARGIKHPGIVWLMNPSTRYRRCSRQAAESNAATFPSSVRPPGGSGLRVGWSGSPPGRSGFLTRCGADRTSGCGALAGTNRWVPRVSTIQFSHRRSFAGVACRATR